MKLIIALFLMVFLAIPAWAMEGVYTVIIKKQEEKQQEKKSSRWTLADWMITKKKIALMDQWLALNTSKTLFEFRLEGAKGEADVDHTGLKATTESKRWGSSLFIRMLGFEYQKNDADVAVVGMRSQESYNAALLLLGGSIQSTSIIAHYGKRRIHLTNQGTYVQNFYGGRLNLYVLPFLGVEARYDRFASENTTHISGFTMAGENKSLSPFIEWGALRALARLGTETRRSFQNGVFSGSEEEKYTFLGLELYL